MQHHGQAELRFPEFPFLYVSGWCETQGSFLWEMWAEVEQQPFCRCHTSAIISCLTSFIRRSCQPASTPPSPGSSSSFSDSWARCAFDFVLKGPASGGHPYHQSQGQDEMMQVSVHSVATIPTCGFQLVLALPYLTSILPSLLPAHQRCQVLASDVKTTGLQRLLNQL